ncbi:hypothetical protein NLI96_g4353 [Meripilus lineatus]|uniref:Major facilitator superfamily (MFS) profile domain-containing protein n=1 Tax=Meripilus lineatus TaxID=2056292 RepID=A0AAD5V7A6_9APHY|nr:hypothetical protein NLI96_g4353 [Physisporinus lineatus]
MASEESPLLNSTNDPIVLKHELVYQRFSPSRKNFVLVLICLAGITPLFVSGTFIPSIPQIAKDLDSTGAVISLAVSLSIFTNCVGSLLWSKYSGYYGRRPIYLVSLTCQCFGSIGVANAQSVKSLLFFRVFQALGSSSGLSNGMGVIADLYKLEERGTAAGTYFGFVLLGPAIAPLAGGIATHYYSWRAMQGSLFVFALFMFLVFLAYFPETSHPGARGVDKVVEKGGKVRLVVLNPFSSLWLLRSPNVGLVKKPQLTILISFSFNSISVLMIPISYTLGAKFGIANEALLGALFIPNGIGNLLGAYISGRLSDKEVIKRRKARGGEWCPEDRLRVALVGALVYAPLSILLSGIVTDYVPGTTGIVLNLFFLFINGLGVDFVLSPSGGYNVDILHSQSAEVTAANMAFRGSIVAVATSLAIPSIQTIGIAATDGIAAVLGWVAFGILWSVIRYGDRMRAYVDVGFSTARDN